MALQEVPVLPVLAKADCMTTAELDSFREHVRTALHHVSGHYLGFGGKKPKLHDAENQTKSILVF